MNDDMDWARRLGAAHAADGVGWGGRAPRAPAAPPRSWVLLAALVFIAVGIVLWLENRRACP